MADSKISVQTEKPAIVNSDSFDVFNGKGGLDRSAYKAASFHTTSDTMGDARFKDKATLMGSSAEELNGVEEKGETASEMKQETALGRE